MKKENAEISYLKGRCFSGEFEDLAAVSSGTSISVLRSSRYQRKKWTPSYQIPWKLRTEISSLKMEITA